MGAGGFEPSTLSREVLQSDPLEGLLEQFGDRFEIDEVGAFGVGQITCQLLEGEHRDLDAGFSQFGKDSHEVLGVVGGDNRLRESTVLQLAADVFDHLVVDVAAVRFRLGEYPVAGFRQELDPAA